MFRYYYKVQNFKFDWILLNKISTFSNIANQFYTDVVSMLTKLR
jgi:hypothetical protein